MRRRVSCEKLAHECDVHAVKAVEIRDSHTLVDLVDRSVHDAELHDLSTGWRDETTIGGATRRRELRHAARNFRDGGADRIGELADRGKEGLTRNEPLDRVPHAMA